MNEDAAQLVGGGGHPRVGPGGFRQSRGPGRQCDGCATAALLGIAVRRGRHGQAHWWYSTNNGANWNAPGRWPATTHNCWQQHQHAALLPAQCQLLRHAGHGHHFPGLGPDQRLKRRCRPTPHQQRRHDGLLHGHRHGQSGDQSGGRHAVGDRDATTNEDTQTTGGLVISRNITADRAEVTLITGISNGTLYQNDGTTPISNGTFITFAKAVPG